MTRSREETYRLALTVLEVARKNGDIVSAAIASAVIAAIHRCERN